jgi:hypothetical protein
MYGLEGYAELAYAQVYNEHYNPPPPPPPPSDWTLINDSQTANWVIIDDSQ